MRHLALSFGVIGFFLASSVQAADIGFAEEFALAKDRAEALKKLIPGTEDYYYFHCLHYLNCGQHDKAVALFKPWFQHFNQTPRLTEMQTRHALLNYDRNPQQALAYLRSHLGLYFDHQKIVQGGAPDLPTVLNPKTISREALAAYSRVRWQQGADNFEDLALDWLLTEQTEPNLRRHILGRLTRPDVPVLAKIVADDLNFQHSGGFGSFNIHRQLTLAQLDQLLKLKPELLDNANFVQAWISKLHPGDDEDWRRDPARTKAYLDRLLTFTRKLGSAFNNLKAHVLFHRLVLDQAQGKLNKDLFVEYLKLPRFQNYMAAAMLNDNLRPYHADLNANVTPWTMLGVVGNDEPLVRRYLKELLAKAPSPKEFEPWINDVYLRHLFAETNIELGQGEPETWAAQLPPELFRQLKDRVDIDFAFTNKTDFGNNEPVKLELFIKNVPTLMVKVFEVNTQNFYRTQKREVDTAINLDGLVANWEKTLTFTESPFRRVGQTFDFPQLTKPGVYVVDFIGAGKSSRALIRKGRLRTLQGMSTAGQKLTIVDEAGQLVDGAMVWLNGQEFKANDKGVVLVPFSTAPGRQPLVISQGDFSSLDFLDHQAENYTLTAGIHVDRESLLTQRLASVLVRPSLRINGLPVSVKLLEEVRLVIVAIDQDGIASSTEAPDFKLFEDREAVHEFRVPSRLQSLNVSLQAKVKSLSLGKQVDVSAQQTFSLNGISRTDKIEDLHLAKFGDHYAIEVLGRTGEAKPDRPVQLSIKHREFREQTSALLKSDPNGRLWLGELKDIATITATGPEGVSHTWALPLNQHTYRTTVHAQAGEPIAIPYLGSADKPMRSELALFEMRGAVIQADRFDNLGIKEGMIEMTGLPAGDFELILKETGKRVRVRVAEGTLQAGHVLGKLRHLQLPALKPVQIAGIASDVEFVTIRLRDYSPFTRLHVYGTRYLPAFSAFDNLGRVRDAELQGAFPLSAESLYLAGRNIGDEYRYVLDRRLHKKFPGNMLERPALLLNPWVLRSTETGEQMAQAGEDYLAKLKQEGGRKVADPHGIKKSGDLGDPEPGAFANLDFLDDASAALLNLVPDKNGFVKIPRKALGAHAMIHVLAVDPVNTTARSITLPEQKAAFVDLRLRNGLNPHEHFTQQKQINTLSPGQPFVLADASASRFEVYDSLSKVYGLYATLSHNHPYPRQLPNGKAVSDRSASLKLAEFSFILNWPTLKLEEKKSLYSKFACHELNFFLARKDPAFFKNVVQPYLANKKDKTFLDHWLLESDLTAYAQPWQHARLNAVERILLAQRLAGEPVKTARHLNDLLRLLPPDLQRERMLYETALKAGELGNYRNDHNFLEQYYKNEIAPAATLPAFDSGPGNVPAPAAPPTGALILRTEVTLDASAAGMAFAARDGRSRKQDKDSEALEAMPTPKESIQQLDELTLFDDSRSMKDAPARLYRKLDPTLELAENNYYKLPIQEQTAALIGVSDFWVDFARHDGKSPFLSHHLADASRNFTEMMFALAVLDLPFTTGKNVLVFNNGKITFTPSGSALMFHEEVKPVAGLGDKVQILVSQNFYRHGDRYKDENGERLDKFVTDEFVIQTVYGCQVVVTNPTPSRQRLSVLIQVPVGAMPVSNGQPTKTVHLDLEPYHTQIVDYQFYFPKSGQFAHFPVHVAKAEALVAAAAPFSFNVVDKPTKLDTESWDYVAQNGSAEQVFAMIGRENIHALDLDKIAFRMRDKAFFETALATVQERHAFNATLWSYGIYHNDLPAARQYLAHVDTIVNECGGPIDSSLLTVDPVGRHQFEHLEYRPILNARAHSLGHVRQIVNGPFQQQYERFMKTLTYRPKLNDDDLLAVSYYLLLQDRVEEALTTFAQVNPAKVATQIQYDYCAAYLDLFSDDVRKARSIVAKYGNYPVERWKNAFTAIANQLDEIEGKLVKVADPEDQLQQQAKLAAKEASFEFGVAAKTINLTWKNLETVRVNYYLMDVELLFSRNPFVQQSGGQFAMIRPNETKEYQLPNFQTKLAIPMPENLNDKNVLVEIVANGKSRSQPVLANAMSLSLNENYGQLQVTDAGNGKSLAKVYVKTYVRLADGTVKFHKDGYTDQRGKFDYASVSTPERSPIARYGILVLSETQGAIIREAAPPQQ
jgi:hypothetical protein